jgi:hypothetical protein
MKHTGTIEIDCGDNTCDECQSLIPDNDRDLHTCGIFGQDYSYYDGVCKRCPSCLETFKEIKDEEIKS